LVIQVKHAVRSRVGSFAQTQAVACVAFVEAGHDVAKSDKLVQADEQAAGTWGRPAAGVAAGAAPVPVAAPVAALAFAVAVPVSVPVASPVSVAPAAVPVSVAAGAVSVTDRSVELEAS